MPDWAQYVRQNLGVPRLQPEREAEIVEELAGQLEQAYAEAIERGMSPTQAEAAARQHVADWAALATDLGRSERGRESALAALQREAEDREAARRGAFSPLTDLRRDLRYAFRVLAKSRGLTSVAVLTMALGIGANTAIFSLLDAVMLRSLPVSRPQEVVLLQWTALRHPAYESVVAYGDCQMKAVDGPSTGCTLSKAFLAQVRAMTDLFSGFATFSYSRPMILSGNGPASRATAQYVSGDYFGTLGVRAAAGRLLIPADDTPQAPAAAVLNYGYWQGTFGGDPTVVGRTIHLESLPFTIVGVAEPSFVSLTPGNADDMWIPFAERGRLEPVKHPERLEDAGSWWLVMVARLRPGVSRAQAEGAVSQLFFNHLVHAPKPLAKAEDAPAIRLLPVQTGLTGYRRELSKPLNLLMVAVAILLLIACANVAGLLLARAKGRQKEIAVRLAMGASRGRIARQLLTESLSISAAGGLLGIAMAYWSARALLIFLTSTNPRALGFSVRIDLPVLAFTACASMLTGVLFGLAPALRSMHLDLLPALKEEPNLPGPGAAGRGWRRSGAALVVGQVALTIVVLMGAGLMVRTLRNLRSLDPGFQPANVLTFGVDPTLTGFRGDRLGQFYRELRDRFSEIPGVLSAGYSDVALLSNGNWMIGFHLEGRSEVQMADQLAVGPGFFATMGMPILAGREFAAADFTEAAWEPGAPCRNTDRANSPMAAIVNESFVRTFFPKTNPVGLRFGSGHGEGPDATEGCASPGWEIIGVTRDAKYGDLRTEVHPTIYEPDGSGGIFELRTAGDPRGVIAGARRVVERSGYDLPLYEVKTQTQIIDELLFQERLLARLSTFFGLLALLLASVGLYGLLSYEVTQGTREVGIRMALGAQRGDVLRRVVLRGIALVGAGAALGAATSLGVARFLGSMLFEVKPSDPFTLAGVVVLLLLVALVACYIPARRATRVDPLVALRYE
jgi:predicted permease